MRHSLFFMLLGGTLLLQGCQPATQQKTVRPNQAPVSVVATASHCIDLVKNPSSPSILLGYGSGDSLAAAKQQAYADIAEQIEVGVISRSEAYSKKHNTAVTQRYTSRVTTFAETTLDDLSLECLDKPGDGSTHVVLGYDIRPLGMRLGDKLIEHLGFRPSPLRLTGPGALNSSQLALDLHRHVSDPGGGKAATMAISLHHRQQRWQLGIGDLFFPLSNSQLAQAVNWQSLDHGNHSLTALAASGKPLPGNIETETEFRLSYRSPRKGYLQLLAVYENGDVDILRNDVPTSAGRTHTFPENGGIFEAGLFEAGKQATDVYLALVTSTPLTNSRLQLKSSSANDDNHHLQDLLFQLESGRLSVSALPITILPRQY